MIFLYLMKYYLYIIYSEEFDKFYIGYSTDVNQRIKKHNTSKFNTFTSKYRPWVLKAVFLTENKATAIKMERFIKKQKSRRLLTQLIKFEYVPTGILAQLVRVLP